MKTVLAAIDFSPVTRAVLKAASELARAVRGRVIVMNVVQPPSLATDLAPLVGDVLQFTDQLERGARRRLDRIQERHAVRGLKVETVCRTGGPVATLLAHAQQEKADYIVLGSHGHTAFHDLVAGGTASGVLKRATCPVMVVPALRPESRKGAPRPATGGAKGRT